MWPVLFHVVVPEGLGRAAVVLLAAGVVALRAVLWVRRARAEGERATLLDALRADAVFAGALAAVTAAVWKAGLLDRELRLPVHAYGVLVGLGFVLGVHVAQREARRRGQEPERIAGLAFWVGLAALAGSRAYFVAVNPGEFFGPGAFVATPLGRLPRLLVPWEGGLVFYGGFLAATLAAFLYLRRHRMPFLAHADTVIPSVALGHFLGRLGCFCAGCCWGAAADGGLPWAVRFPPDSLAWQTLAARAHPERFLAAGGATTLPLHPVQLYEAAGELAVFALLVLVVRPRKRFDGQVLAAWLVLYALLRTAVEVFRGDVERGVWAGLGAGQWTSFAIFAAGVAVWVRAREVRATAPARAAAGR